MRKEIEMTLRLIPTTNQELLNMATIYFRQQQYQSYEGFNCQYLTTTGDRCVIGYCLPLEELLDVYGISGYFDNGPIIEMISDGLISISPFISLTLLEDLQALHDSDSNWIHDNGDFAAWDELKKIATEYNLTFEEEKVLVLC